MQTINITHELKRFEQHLAQNPQTILSAKFGDGKTYFLNEYIRQHEADTFFVVLHPVNYVVSPNEDIFEYIKRDILCALMHTEELQNIDWKKTIKDVLLSKDFAELTDDMLTMLAPHLQMINKVIPIAKILHKSVDLVMQVRDKVSLNKYIEHFQEVKGSLFELDDISIVIQKTIQAIQAHEKRCVLVIEDLDRLDPGHLFRILNVLSAHIDSDKCTNKFCFDNIVAVLDYDTTRHIFHHFYSEKANYEGYMSKFMSSHPFEYSITKVAHEQLEAYLKNDCRIESLGNFPKNTSGLSLVEKINNMSVRDVEHVLNGIEHQIIQCDVEICASTKIRPIDYATKLFSVLVKMNYKVSSKLLANYFGASINNLRVLNNYLLTTPNISVDLLNFQKSHIRIYMALDGDYSIVTNIGEGGGYMSDIVISEVIDKAINIIKKEVKDCDQVVI